MESIYCLSERDMAETCVGFAREDLSKYSGAKKLKRFLVVMYFRENLTTFGKVVFSLENLINETGFSSKSHNATYFNDYKDILQDFVDEKLITLDRDVADIKPSAAVVSTVINPSQLFFTDRRYVKASIKEYKDIVAARNNGVNPSILFGVFLYIKQFIPSGTNTCKISFPSKELVASELGISEHSYKRAIKVLCDNKLLYKAEGLYIKNKQKDGSYVAARNVYALTPEDLDEKAVIAALTEYYKCKVYVNSDTSKKEIIVSDEDLY